MKPAAPPCDRCEHFVAGFRGRRVHVDGQGSLIRGLDHEPERAAVDNETSLTGGDS